MYKMSDFRLRISFLSYEWIPFRLLRLVSRYLSRIYDYLESCRDVDEKLATLGVDLDELGLYLNSFRDAFNNRSLTWETLPDGLKSSFKACERTLINLHGILEKIDDVDFGGRMWKKFKFDRQASKIETLQKRISAYTRTLHYSLQLII